MYHERENEKHARGEGARRGAGRQWRESEGAGRAWGGLVVVAPSWSWRQRGGGQCGHHRLGLRLDKSVTDYLILFWLGDIHRGLKVLWGKWKPVTYPIFLGKLYLKIRKL